MSPPSLRRASKAVSSTCCRDFFLSLSRCSFALSQVRTSGTKRASRRVASAQKATRKAGTGKFRRQFNGAHCLPPHPSGQSRIFFFFPDKSTHSHSCRFFSSQLNQSNKKRHFGPAATIAAVAEGLNLCAARPSLRTFHQPLKTSSSNRSQIMLAIKTHAHVCFKFQELSQRWL